MNLARHFAPGRKPGTQLPDDGSAATVRDVLATRNHHDDHRHTSNPTLQEISDLCAYLLPL